VPHKFNAVRRDKIPKRKQRVTNWAESHRQVVGDLRNDSRQLDDAVLCGIPRKGYLSKRQYSLISEPPAKCDGRRIKPAARVFYLIPVRRL
jgi:hypothetical protein